MAALYSCKKCKTYLSHEPEQGGAHPHNVCPGCGEELTLGKYDVEYVPESFYEHTPKLPCHPNYLH